MGLEKTPVVPSSSRTTSLVQDRFKTLAVSGEAPNASAPLLKPQTVLTIVNGREGRDSTREPASWHRHVSEAVAGFPTASAVRSQRQGRNDRSLIHLPKLSETS